VKCLICNWEVYLIRGCYIDWGFSWLFSDFTGKWQTVAIINRLWYCRNRMTCLHIVTHFVPALKRRAELWILVAISFSPWGPWYTAYMADMLASSAWAVQMLLVALSRLMCCSLVCKARRYASWPLASLCRNVSGDKKLRAAMMVIFELLIQFLNWFHYNNGNDMVVVYCVLKRMWKEEVMTHFKILL
jgi:hypothetical protein